MRSSRAVFGDGDALYPLRLGRRGRYQPAGPPIPYTHEPFLAAHNQPAAPGVKDRRAEGRRAVPGQYRDQFAAGGVPKPRQMPSGSDQRAVRAEYRIAENAGAARPREGLSGSEIDNFDAAGSGDGGERAPVRSESSAAVVAAITPQYARVPPPTGHRIRLRLAAAR